MSEDNRFKRILLISVVLFTEKEGGFLTSLSNQMRC